jgi:DNA-binding transcriptional ArsR family regulator
MSDTTGQGDSDEVWILDRDQLATLASPVRMDIVDQLASREAMPVRELAAAIDRQPSALYHHLDKLLRVGLVVEKGTQAPNRRAETLYTTPARRMRLRGALEQGEQPEIMRQIVGALCRQANRDFDRGLEAGGAEAAGDGRNLGFFRLIARADPASLRKINSLLDEVGNLMWECDDPDGTPVALTWVMTPRA